MFFGMWNPCFSFTKIKCKSTIDINTLSEKRKSVKILSSYCSFFNFCVFKSHFLSLSTQALADELLHHVRCSLLCVRHLRNVHVLLVQATGQRARGGLGCTPANELSTDQLPASRVPHGAAPCCHGHRLLPRLCGNCHTLLFIFSSD